MENLYRLGIAGILIMVLILLDCGDNSSKKQMAPSITVYTALESELVTEYLKSFTKHHPDINVRIIRESTGIITARLLAEKGNPQADVVWGTAASSMLILDEQGLLEPYAPKGLEQILPQFKSEKPVPTWVGMTAWETAFVVNTVEIAKLGISASDIKGYEDLLRPQLRGQVTMPNPNSSGTGLLTVAGVLQLRGRDGEAGWEYLTRLHDNIKQYTHSGSKPARMAGSGECVVGVSFGYAGISQKQKGAPVEIVFPAEGSGWDLEANALIRKPGISSSAKIFLDWAISDDAMNSYRVSYPIITNGKGGNYEGFDGDPIKQLIPNDLGWIAGNRESILEKWVSKFDGKTESR
ncbi:MAG: putative 2-aminoethylphosphonate ABC transporter substrate-binding protein [Chitinispirillia bacterium]|nr:putative 2-aminoethylphosphonate ABC transporter substrate-binding protein [Chitinispirillia bacterium]MCL2269066.1 putative 2-aminoethylphosphonate ABC transporter substrate-binding protein [Chitinispirillia bacterium]